MCWKTAFSSFMINFNTNRKSICWKLSILLWHSYSSKLSLSLLIKCFPLWITLTLCHINELKRTLFIFKFIQRQIKQTRPPTIPNNAWKLWQVWKCYTSACLKRYAAISTRCRNLQETTGWKQPRLSDVISATFMFPNFWPYLFFFFFFAESVAKLKLSSSLQHWRDRIDKMSYWEGRESWETRRAESETKGREADGGWKRGQTAAARQLPNISHNISFLPSDSGSEVQPRADRLTVYFSSALPPWTSY